MNAGRGSTRICAEAWIGGSASSAAVAVACSSEARNDRALSPTVDDTKVIVPLCT